MKKTIEKFEVFKGRARDTLSIRPVGKNGSRLRCPYGVTTYDDLGGEYPPECGSWCPHFGDLERKNLTYTVKLSCGGGNGVLQSKKAVVYQ